MDIKKGRPYLILSDLEEHSLWKFSDIDDLTYPVICKEDFPEDIFDLKIRAKFITPCGIELLGYLVGAGEIYCIAIFAGDKVFYFNRNRPQDYAEKLNEMNQLLGKNLTLENFSPLKYTTDIDLEGLGNFEGEFDLLKKRTNEERLRGYEGNIEAIVGNGKMIKFTRKK